MNPFESATTYANVTNNATTTGLSLDESIAACEKFKQAAKQSEEKFLNLKMDFIFSLI
jgi:hypothetical protein